MSVLWLAVVALAAVCGYQQGRISANREFGQASLQGIERIETRLETISNHISVVNAEGGAAVVYVRTPLTEEELRDRAIRDVLHSWEALDGLRSTSERVTTEVGVVGDTASGGDGGIQRNAGGYSGVLRRNSGGQPDTGRDQLPELLD